MTKKIIDKNLEVKTSIGEANIKFYDSRWEPFDIYGLYDPKNESAFKRLPDEIGLNVNDGVSFLYLHTAGGRLRFATDSPYVAIKAELHQTCRFPHMTLLTSTGFDLYEDTPSGVSTYRGSFMPPYNLSDSYESVIYVGSREERKLRYYTVNFPAYGGVVNLYVGLENGSSLEGGLRYKNELPVIYYGSSITQGGCASRPGTIYQNFISRSLNMDYINLGFSGSGRAEDSIVDYMCSMEMCAFVSDYDHNAPSPEYLRDTHLKMYKKIRAAHPNIPYIMLSRPDFDSNYDDSILRRDVIIDTYRYARESGDMNAYYIDGESLFRGEFEDACTVDRTHPNDLGFAMMAKAIECELKRALMREDYTKY